MGWAMSEPSDQRVAQNISVARREDFASQPVIAPSAPVRRDKPAVAALLSLQQQAGNQAVSRMLASGHLPTREVIQRCGLVPPQSCPCRDEDPAVHHERPDAPAISTALQLTRLGTQVTHPSGSRSSFRSVTATFDGEDFIVSGDGTVILNTKGQSGRPITVRSADRRACHGTPNDSYLNNPRYVGIADNGPIPEGDYRFTATQMTTFSLAEQAQMILGGSFTDPLGHSLHGGDWGSGRVALEPRRIVPSRFCGNTRSRSGFFLHGGVLPGSSGCIDIGDSAFDSLVRLLLGYRTTITVTVQYRHPPPDPGALTRALGRFTYPQVPGHRDPTIWERLGSVFGGDED
jgi:hypothetical protein